MPRRFRSSTAPFRLQRRHLHRTRAQYKYTPFGHTAMLWCCGRVAKRSPSFYCEANGKQPAWACIYQARLRQQRSCDTTTETRRSRMIGRRTAEGSMYSL